MPPWSSLSWCRGIRSVPAMRPTKIALVIEYDGTRFHGFQLQPQGPTVQGELERAIQSFTGERVRVLCASRTDAGVHATGQVVSFRTEALYPPQTFVGALNHFLPEEISVRGAYGVEDGFHVQKAARGRQYEYLVLNRRTPSPLLRYRAHGVATPLDLAAMREAAALLVGEHDFASFAGPLAPPAASTRKRLTNAQVACDRDLVIFTVAGNAFLHQQVRRMLGSLLEVGLARMTKEALAQLLAFPKRGAGGPTLPARGLCLTTVYYDNFPPVQAEAAA